MKDLKNVIITGFAMFSIFFGAGNLIFPPTLGFISGSKWAWTAIGFLLTCIGLPLLGIVSVALAGGSTEDVTNKVGKTFGKVMCSIIMLCIGPLFCIPRTGATTFELGISPVFPKCNITIMLTCYFIITFIFAINESKVIDKVGSILTPFLLICLSVIIFKGILKPIGTPIYTGIENPFAKGFTEGYQTMDALGSIIVAQMIIVSLIGKGYKTRKQQIDITLKSGIVSTICLVMVYGGLLYIGATGSGIFPENISRTEILVRITNEILGGYGKYVFGIAISIACLTTSVGLTATAGNYFSKLTNFKVPYKIIVLIICIVSYLISTFGVETIINLAVPVLQTTYPIMIVLIIINLFNGYINNRGIYIGSVYGAFIASIFNSLQSMGIKVGYVTKFVNCLPFANEGFAWIIPAIIGGIIGYVYCEMRLVSINETE